MHNDNKTMFGPIKQHSMYFT